ncbi:hypothetical protein COK86_13705 [Bacillus cereus]|uniref:Uncharacterized protein n=1 Tax=Bacillus cereus TaxID=1396 RepID=A0A2B3TZW9_BACCE|nr:hypothetical protein [Bacillus cereus]PFU42228.1 hypothetical protein COK86_13705 [Bacillus cereus]
MTNNKIQQETRKRLRSILGGIKSRTCNPDNQNYHHYGGRGITICEEWKNSIDSFVEWSLENGYKEGLSLDRINPNGNYEPSNCRWANAKQQVRNLRDTYRIEFKNKAYACLDVTDTFGSNKIIIDNEITYTVFSVTNIVNYDSLNYLLRGFAGYGLTLENLLWLYHNRTLSDFIEENILFAFSVASGKFKITRNVLKYNEQSAKDIALTFKQETEKLLNSNEVNKGKTFNKMDVTETEEIFSQSYYFLKMYGIFTKIYTMNPLNKKQVTLIVNEELRLKSKYFIEEEIKNNKEFNNLLTQIEHYLKDVFYTPITNNQKGE